MKKRFTLALLLFATVARAQTTPTGAEICAQGRLGYYGSTDPRKQGRLLAPTVISAGDSTIDVTYYGLDITLTLAPNYVRGATTVTFKAVAPSITQFFLDLNSILKVDSVKAGAQKLTAVHDQNRLTISLPQPLSRGQTGRVTVFYQGLPNTPNAGITDQAFVFGTHETTKDPVVYSLSEPFGASDWFPCKDTPADKADSSAVNITAPAVMVSASNGLLQGITTNANGTKTYRWKNSYPIAQYLISVASSNYAQYDNPVTYQGQTMPVTHYIFPEDLPAARTALTETNNMIAVFSDLFGTYPFIREKYGHAQFLWAGGMEHQTISSMTKSALTRDVISHELMHQWFGDKITCRNWENIWLNEGFASYGEALYREALSGQTAYQSYMANFMAQARQATGTLYVQSPHNINQIFNYNRSYAKGAVVLHMLRGVLGDADYFKGMRAYLTSSVAYGTAVTEDLQRSMETATGKPLGYFFRQWVYGEGFPAYTWSVAPVAGTNRAVVRLEQTAGTNPTSFTMPVQISLQSVVGNQVVTVLNDQRVQSFTVTGSGPITGAVLDPNNLILKTVTQVNPPTETLVLATETPTALRVFPNPGADVLMAEFTTHTAGPLTLTLLNTLGQQVGNQAETNVPAGNHRRTFPLRGLLPGRYILQGQTADGPVSVAVLVN